MTSLTITISLGFCKHLRELTLNDYARTALLPPTLECLGTAIETDTLPALEELSVDGVWEDADVRCLLRAFSKGACPRLRMLDISFRCPIIKEDEDEDEDEDDYDSDDEYGDDQTEMNVESLAFMLETRNGLEFCTQLKEFPDDVLEYGSWMLK